MKTKFKVFERIMELVICFSFGGMLGSLAPNVFGGLFVVSLGVYFVGYMADKYSKEE